MREAAAGSLLRRIVPIALLEFAPPEGFAVEDCEVMKGELWPRTKTIPPRAR